MDYSHFSDFEIKKILVRKMREHESFHYVSGWLEVCYLLPGDAELERNVAIKEIKRYDGIKK